MYGIYIYPLSIYLFIHQGLQGLQIPLLPNRQGTMEMREASSLTSQRGMAWYALVIGPGRLSVILATDTVQLQLECTPPPTRPFGPGLRFGMDQ